MKKTVVIIVVILCIIAIGVCSAILYSRAKQDNSQFLGTDVINSSENETGTIVAEVPGVQIFKGSDRPIAVMIDNNVYAQPQAGLNDAYMVYEIIVEGGESRLMALFKGVSLDKIGPVRSSRHYFLDYALENDVIYVHYGWSPQAQSDISTLGVNNINGISETTKEFWRVSDKSSPHNVATSTEKILEIANRKGYRTTSSKDSVLNYVTDEVNLEAGQIAEDITIPYSQSNTVEWKYNSDTKRYTRYSKGKKQTDWTTGEDVTAKNIIIEFIANSTLNDGENKGRQTMNTVGTKDGYYITNGKAIKITCEKVTRSSQTVYKDENGNEIDVNDGNTFVQICPINANVKIEGVSQE